ncbi:MAG: HD domain-containing protein [Spirochaetaceae bacterium]|jgi:HD-GYP domain-containing protein (c-di-GMP phosphodiesterase class II)|nr:HD domain-containing protein [Spirochaetaceae bacterium]
MVTEQPDYKAILETDSELNKIQDFDILLERILLEARKVVNADAGSIYVKETEIETGCKTEKLAIKYAQNDTILKGLPPGQKSIYSIFKIPIDEKTISGYCAYTRKLLNVKDAYNLPPDVPYTFSSTYDMISGYKTTSILAIPLVTADGRLLGVIQVINARDAHGTTVPFSAQDEFLISHFAENATTALERASMTRAMILRMIKMAELRDPKETGAHVNRVASYAVEIYDRYAFRHGIGVVEQEKFRDTLKIAAMLHDVGKVAISDVILKKPGRFTPEEVVIMQGHTVSGAVLFDDPQSSLDTISMNIALCHHENWDGSGYPGWVDIVTGVPQKTGPDGKPLGKTGEEIPLESRIVAIADVFDALGSKRVYKEAWDETMVYAEIRKESGIKFDPELVEIFFEIIPSIKQIQNLYPESKAPH